MNEQQVKKIIIREILFFIKAALGYTAFALFLKYYIGEDLTLNNFLQMAIVGFLVIYLVRFVFVTMKQMK
ncbi:hypothetical protein AAG747_12565 [Rapidithrix thailandica]|uniref:Uncharacterized protein n=1 Tax=Rapidithrix thailandica TaxID=413964 RepID=A0AAW9RY75_9BACT